MQLTSFVSPCLWALTVGAGVGKVSVEKNVAISRACDLTTIISVAADYAYQYSQDHDPTKLAALINFSMAASRTVLILAFDFSEKTRRRISKATFCIAASVVVGSQFLYKQQFDISFHHHMVNPVAGLLLLSAGIGSYMDSRVGKDESREGMIVRRRCFLAIGFSSMMFGALTSNWGLAIKNLIANVGVTGIAMIKHKDALPVQNILRNSTQATQQMSRALHESTQFWARQLMHLKHD